MWPDFAKLLQYGFSGLTVILVFLSFYLLRQELKRPRPRSTGLLGILSFMVLSLLFAVLALIGPDTLRENLARLLQPEPDKVCAQHIAKIKELERSMERLKDVKIVGKILGPPDPFTVTILAKREWRLDNTGDDGRFKRTISHGNAALRLLFSSGDYEKIVEVDEENLKDGSCSVGEIKLRKVRKPYKALTQISSLENKAAGSIWCRDWPLCLKLSQFSEERPTEGENQ